MIFCIYNFRLENSAVDIAESIQHGGLPATTGSVGPSILEVVSRFDFLFSMSSALLVIFEPFCRLEKLSLLKEWK